MSKPILDYICNCYVNHTDYCIKQQANKAVSGKKYNSVKELISDLNPKRGERSMTTRTTNILVLIFAVIIMLPLILILLLILADTSMQIIRGFSHINWSLK